MSGQARVGAETVTVGGRDYLAGHRDTVLADAIKKAGHEIAEAIVLLARATAGEFDEPDETIDPDATRLPDGYRGMR